MIRTYVTANPHVQGGLNWAGVKWAFGNTKQAAYWAPVMWLSHMLACQLFGLNPWGHHLINVLLHALNTVLVFLLLRRLTGANWRSWMVAALFGLHPLRVESVAWVTERKDVLSAGFGLLALVFYARYAQERSSVERRASGAGNGAIGLRPSILDPRLCAGFVFLRAGIDEQGDAGDVAVRHAAAGLLAITESSSFKFSVSSPGPTPRSTFNSQLSTLVVEKLPFFGLAAVASVVTFVVQLRGGALDMVQNLPFGARVGNALISYCRYLGKMFWPTDLAVFYPHPGYWPLEQVLLAGGLLLGITVLFFATRRRYPFLLMGWLWFCGTLVPVIELVQSGEQAMADRFTYVPLLGMLVIVIWGAYELTRSWRYQETGVVGSGLCGDHLVYRVDAATARVLEGQ